LPSGFVNHQRKVHHGAANMSSDATLIPEEISAPNGDSVMAEAPLTTMSRGERAQEITASQRSQRGFSPGGALQSTASVIRSQQRPRGFSPGRALRRTSSAVAAGVRRSSDYSLNAIPRDKIVKRTLHPWSVHHSVATSNWIATISRPAPSENGVFTNKLRYVQFIFKTEKEARKFCKAYAPPKPVVSTEGKCHYCGKTGCFRHCKNCGVCCCEQDLTKWGTRMIPKTYLTVEGGKVVRVCHSCDWLSNAFCMSLLQGRYEDALELFETGNINLRTCFADIHQEAMFPVHCAVMGGSFELLKWLVDGQQCPISARADPKTGRALSVQTSGDRTLLDLAMTGRPKLQILSYLINKGLSMSDVKDPSLASKTLEALMQSNFAFQAEMPQQLNIVESSFDESVATIEDACNICFERPMDCVLTPCGHQICCSDCGKQLQKCPVCKVSCSFLKVFKS